MLFILILVVIAFFAFHNFAGKKRAKLIQLQKQKVEKFRECPDCYEHIQINAKVCRYCHKELSIISVEELEKIQLAYIKELDSLDKDEVT